MVSKAHRVSVRYLTANVSDKMESAIDDLNKVNLVGDFGMLRTLLEHVSRQTKMSNPEISHEAHALSKVFEFAHKFVKDEVLGAIHSTRDLLDSVVF